MSSTTAESVVLTLLVVTASLSLVPPSTGAEEPLDGPWWWPTQGQWLETDAFTFDDVADPPGMLFFGSESALDGDTLVVSTQVDMFTDVGTCDHYQHGDTGCDWVFVFNRAPKGDWHQTAQLVPQDARLGDTFGYSLAVDEESGVIVVGNPGTNEQSNQIYIFERDQEGAWQETATFEWINPDPPWNTFGRSVAVSGYTVATTGNKETYVIEKIDGVWTQTTVLPGGAGPRGLALEGDVLVNKHNLREPRECPPTGDTKKPRVQIWERTESDWELIHHFNPKKEHGNRSQTSPTRLALSSDGSTLLIGAAVDRRVMGVHTEHCVHLNAPEPIGNVTVNTIFGAAGAVGSAWIYERIGDEWLQTADIPNPTPNQGDATFHSLFGASVSIDGDIALIGAEGDVYNGGPGSGAAFVYKKTDDGWILDAKLRNHDSSPIDEFGSSVAVSGDTLVVGAQTNKPIGTLHVYESMSDWMGRTIVG